MGKYFALSIICLLLTATAFSQNKDELEKKIDEAFSSQHYKEVIRLSNKLLAIDSNSVSAYISRANAYRVTKEFQKALDDYTKAIALEPKNPKLYGERAIFFFSMQQPEDAIEDNNTALKYVVNDDTLKYMLINNRGNAKGMKRDFRDAYDDYMEVLSHDSTNMSALTNIGAVLDDLKRSDEAIFYLKRVIRLYPKFVGGYGNLAFVQLSCYKKRNI